MNPGWYAERNDRSMRYAGRVLDPERWVVVRAPAEVAQRYDGQVALLTAVNLLGRMTPSVALCVPDVVVVPPLPWAGSLLRDVLAGALRAADPTCRLNAYVPSSADYVLDVGPESGAHAVHGSGWNMFAGPGASPIRAVDEHNPVGPSMAAILGVSQLFVRELRAPEEGIIANAWTWEERALGDEAPVLPEVMDLGDVWSVGVGSVGTAILYFLTLVTQSFSSVLFDMDEVKLHNLDRSPVFGAVDVGHPKAHATSRFLRNVGVASVSAEAVALDESPRWREREPGSPRLLVSAANERNVREVIESAYPPVQIYGTTGKNWQAAMIRHRPIVDPCSCCLFPAQAAPAPVCGGGHVHDRSGTEVDAALPFLSFAAGAMAAAEILKGAAWPSASQENRVVLYTDPRPRFVRARLAHREGCACQARDAGLYDQILGSRVREAITG